MGVERSMLHWEDGVAKFRKSHVIVALGDTTSWHYSECSVLQYVLNTTQA